MASNQYFVLQHEEEWTIKFNGEHTGHFPTRHQAMECAIAMAQKAGDGQVMVQDEKNLFRAAMTFGSDPFPPRA